MAAFDYEKLLAEQIGIATPAERLLMVWEKLMADLASASEAMGKGDHEVASGRLIAAQQVLVILSTTLDQRWDGAARLDALYRWCWERLVEANVRWDKQALLDAKSVLGPLHDAWARAAEAFQPALAAGNVV
jgi:flagellar protein FliS